MLDETLADLPVLDHYLIEHENLGARVKHLWDALSELGETTQYLAMGPRRMAVATEASSHRVATAADIALMGVRWNMLPMTSCSLLDRGIELQKNPSLQVFLWHTGHGCHPHRGQPAWLKQT